MEIPKWADMAKTGEWVADRFNPSFDGNPEMGVRVYLVPGFHKPGFNPSFDGNPEMGSTRDYQRPVGFAFQSFF